MRPCGLRALVVLAYEFAVDAENQLHIDVAESQGNERRSALVIVWRTWYQFRYRTPDNSQSGFLKVLRIRACIPSRR